MIRFVLLLVACLTAPSWGQRVPVYHNRTSVTNQMVIADAFVNDGYFEVQNLLLTTNFTTILAVSTTPYDFSATRRFVNNGTMIGTSIRFDNVDKYGVRIPAETFTNTASGRIDFADGYHLGSFPVFQDFIRGVWSSPFSSIRVNATNIVNQGMMRIGAGGLLRLGHTNQVTGALTADNVDVSTGLLLVDPVGFAYGSTLLGTYDNYVTAAGTYLNDLGVYDVAWGMGTFTNQNQQFFVTSFNPTTVNVPQHRLTNAFGTRFLTSWQLDNAQSFGFTFTVDGTNIYRQTVYVQTGDTNVIPDVRWYPSAYLPTDIFTDSDYFTPIVELRSITTNALTFQIETNAFYIADQLGSAFTNFNIVQNDRYPAYFRPAPYFVSREVPVEFLIGLQSNILATPGLYYPGYSNIVVTNAYAAYVFDLENLVYTVPAVPDASPHDLPGRVEILGRNVDLTGTGIRAEGMVSITADQFEGSAGAIIDAQNLSFNLAFTDPVIPSTPLRIENLAKDRVARLRGQVQLWSGTFTNQFGDANSNVFNVLYHTMVVDARGVNSVQEVSVSDFQVRTADLVIRDNMIVSNQFNVSATSLTVSGNLELRNVQWNTNLPNLLNLTVEPTAVLRLPGLADFGTQARPMQNFINHGEVTAYSQSIVADNVDVSGELRSGQNLFTFFITPFGEIFLTNFFFVDAGPLFITANNSARFTGAEVETYGDITMTGPVYKIDQTRIDSGAAINLNITGGTAGTPTTLVDSGPNAGNVFSSSNYFALNFPVESGSLLGTTINAEPPPRGTYRFRWAMPRSSEVITNIPTITTNLQPWIDATNRAYAVYTDNVGVGRLTLHTGTLTVFEFSGTTQNRALYVDLLEFTGNGITNLTSLTNQLRLLANAAGSIDIYYADIVATNLAANVPLGFATLAEFLNGKRLGGGRLIWVPTFAGPNTSEDVVVNGSSMPMNRPLRRSQIVDMDLDGIANGNDDRPMNPGTSAVTISNIALSQVDGQVTLNFAAFKGTYQVQYTESLQAPVWKVAATYTHSSSTGATVNVADPATNIDKPRFYRLVYTPAN